MDLNYNFINWWDFTLSKWDEAADLPYYSWLIDIRNVNHAGLAPGVFVVKML
jgi:hypothetical protein